MVNVWIVFVLKMSLQLLLNSGLQIEDLSSNSQHLKCVSITRIIKTKSKHHKYLILFYRFHKKHALKTRNNPLIIYLLQDNSHTFAPIFETYRRLYYI